jgi:hypothetical protein
MKVRNQLAKRKAEILRGLNSEEGEELRSIDRALAALDNAPEHSPEANRFRNLKPVTAIKMVLTERDNFMEWDEIETILIKGGLAVGPGRRRERKDDIGVSMKMSLCTGSLIRDLKSGRIGLPEWKDRLKKR